MANAMLESIYYVLTRACNRACRHCYDEGFRPYAPAEEAAMLHEQAALMPRIIANLPETLTFYDTDEQLPGGGFPEKHGRIILSGGEVLLPRVREKLLFPALKLLHDKYYGRVRITVQTGGDLLNAALLDELLEHKVWMISVSSMDDFHARPAGVTMESERERLTRLFEAAGCRASGQALEAKKWIDEAGPVYNFFGAEPEMWIGKLWPSGRAWANSLSTATYADNFCNRWSGGLNYLRLGYSGSEVAIDPEGMISPCCRRTALPHGDLAKEPLADILERLTGNAPFEALNAGMPERMGLSFGVSTEVFIALSTTTTPDGTPYCNPCIGCDAVHRQYLEPLLRHGTDA